jgi:transcriptional regulator with XRE-family HTH domain
MCHRGEIDLAGDSYGRGRVAFVTARLDSQADLANRSGVSEPTIARLESAEGEFGGREDTGEKIRRAIETAGVEFIDENGGGQGVRLRKRQKQK